jgi:hypothetical protein
MIELNGLTKRFGRVAAEPRGGEGPDAILER